LKHSAVPRVVALVLLTVLLPVTALAVSFYDFENLDRNNLIGQDGWTNDLFSIGSGAVQPGGGVNTSLVLRCTNTTGTTYFRRFNNGVYAFNVYSDTETGAVYQFDVQWTNVLDNAAYMAPRGSNQIAFSFGINKSNLQLRGASFGTNIATRPIPAVITNGHWVRLRMVANFTDSTNEGSGVLYYKDLTAGETEFTAWVTNNNLEIMSKAVTNGAGRASSWTGIQFQCDGINYRVDNALVGDADLGVGQESFPEPFYLSDQGEITYFIGVTNFGPMDVTNCVLVNEFPTNSSFASATPSQGTCTQIGGIVVCDIGQLASGNSAQITIVVSNLSNSRIVNRVYATAGMGDGNPLNDTASLTNIIYNSPIDLADITVSKEGLPDPVVAGTGVVSYLITVTNKGPPASYATLIEDMLPPGVEFLPCTPVLGMRVYFPFTSNDYVTTEDASNSGNPGTIINALPITNGFIEASMLFDGEDDYIEVADAADLQYTNLQWISLSARIRPSSLVTQGTIMVKGRNDGTDNATYGLRGDGGRLSFYYSGPSGHHVYRSTAIVLTNNAWEQVGVTYRYTHPNSAKLYVNGVQVPAAWVVLNGLEPPVTTTNPLWLGAVRFSGTNIQHEFNGMMDEVRVYRRGLASNEVYLLGNTNAPRSEQGWEDAGGVFKYDAGVIPSGMSTSTYLRALVLSSTLGTLTNNVAVSNAQIEINTADNSAYDETAVETFADLKVFKSDTPDPVIAGTNLVYSLSVSNAGPSDALGVVITDALPSNLVFNAALSTEGSYYTNGIVTFDLGTRTALLSTSLTVHCSVPSWYATGEIYNLAWVSSETVDLEPGNNATSVPSTVIQRADMRIAQTSAPSPVVAGGSLTYIVTVSNAGPSDADSVFMSDNLPLEVLPNDQIFSNLGYMVVASSYAITVNVSVLSSAFGAITNRVLVTSLTPDPTINNNSNAMASAVTRQSDMAISKTESDDPVLAGDASLIYTITVTNRGPSDAASVIVTDQLPNVVSPSGLYVTNLGNVEAGGVTSFTLSVSVNSAADGAMTNKAWVISANLDPVLTNNFVAEPTTIAQQSDLQAWKSVSPDPVVSGTGIVTYTLTFSNAGPSDAQGVYATDTMPEGLIYLSAMPTSGLQLYYGFISNQGTRYTDLSGNNYTGLVSNAVFTADGALNGGAILFDGDSDRMNVRDVFSAGPHIATGSTFTISAWIKPSSLPSIGTIYNKGLSRPTFSPLVANAVLRSRNAQLEFYYQSAGATDHQFRTTSDVLSAGQWQHVAVTHQMGTNGYTKLFVNGVEQVASWVTGNGNFQVASTTNTPVMIGAEVTVLSTNIINEFVGAIDEIRFYNRVLSSGEVHRLALPLIVEGDTRCVETNGVVTCSVGTLAQGATTSLQIQAIVSDSVLGTISNSVTVDSSVFDANSANDVGTVLHSPTGEADLVVWKVSDQPSVISGQQRTYTITVSNRGPSIATGVTLTDTLPPMTAFVSSNSTPGLSSNGSQVTYTFGTMPTNSGLAVTVCVAVSSGNLAAHLTNTAVISGNQSDPNPADNTTNQVIAASRFVVLQVRLSDAPDPVGAGDTLYYTVIVTNLGPSDAASVTVSNVLPSLATFTTNGSTPGLVGTTNNRVIASLGPLAAGSITTLSINAIASQCSTGSGTFQVFTFSDIGSSGSGNLTTKFDILEPTSGLYDFEQFTLSSALVPQDGWASATGNMTVVNSSGIVSKGARPQTYTSDVTVLQRTNDVRFAFPTFRTNTQDGLVQYDVQDFTNGVSRLALAAGNMELLSFGMTATNAFIVDAAGAMSTGSRPLLSTNGQIIRLRIAVDFTDSDGDGSAVLYALNRSVGESNYATLVTVGDLNLASTLGATGDPANVSMVVVSLSDSNLVDNIQVSEADVGVTHLESTDPVIAGSNITFTVIASNRGPMVARNVIAAEWMPSSAQFGGGSAPGGSLWVDGCTVFVPMGDIGKGASVTATVLMAYTVAGTATNTVCVQSAYYDPNQTNNIFRTTTVVLPGSDQTIWISDSSDPVVAGGTLTYTVFVTNRGPHSATNVVVTNTLPAGVTPTGTIVTNFGTMAAGATTSYSVNVSVPPSLTGVLTNQATVTFVGNEADQSNNSAVQLTTIQPQADLSVWKYDSSDPIFAGDEQIYTIVVSNAGPSDAGSVLVVDHLPPGSTPAGPVTNVIPMLVSGSATSFTLNVTISSMALGEVTNFVTVSSDAFDPDEGGNTAGQTTTIDVLSDLALAKSAVPDVVSSNSFLTYSLLVTNSGPSAALSVTVTDALPTEVTFQSASGDGTHNAGIVSFGPFTVDAGQATSLTIQVDVNIGTLGAITNTAAVQTPTAESSLANNTGSLVTPVPDSDEDGDPNFGDVDDDNDGIPDAWEALYGLNSTNAADAAADTDADLYSNLQEYYADTVPTNASSFHRLSVVSNRPPRSLTFPSSTARVYGIEYSTSLVGGIWVPIATNLPGQSGSTTISITNTDAVLHYRIGVGFP
jgi:uncharacterized repeat protein (TIGR01451 family)